MNKPSEYIDLEKDYIKLNEGITILWNLRKYRNEVFYSSVYRWGAAILLITLSPYLLPDIIKKLGLAVLVFPVIAFFVSGFASYLSAVQYKLYKQADHKLRSLLGRYKPDDPPFNKPIDRIFRIPLGLSISLLFLFFAVIVQILNAIILFYLVSNS